MLETDKVDNILIAENDPIWHKNQILIDVKNNFVDANIFHVIAV